MTLKGSQRKMNDRISRRNLIASVPAVASLSGCLFVPGGPKARDLDLDDVTVRDQPNGSYEITVQTDFYARNWDESEAFREVSIIGFTDSSVQCRDQITADSESLAYDKISVTLRCRQLPEYITTAFSGSCTNTHFGVYRLNRSDGDASIEYVGERSCGDDVTAVPER